MHGSACRKVFAHHISDCSKKSVAEDNFVDQPLFLPCSCAEMDRLGWNVLDVLLVSGDAYVDHPSFAMALLGRWLLAHGFRVGVISQPRWKDRQQALEDISVMGRPRLFAGVASGAVDSMLAHYTAFRKKRPDDAYTPGGRAGARPNRACIVYTGLVRQSFPGLPVVLGGIEASLRRTSHYDFWADALHRPLLQDSKADLLVYGMGERSLLALARAANKLLATRAREEQDAPLERRAFVSACRAVPGVAWMDAQERANTWLTAQAASVRELPSHEALLANPPQLVHASMELERHMRHSVRHKSRTDCLASLYLMQAVGGRALVLTPPAAPLDEEELDFLYSLPFSRLPHPRYTEPIPAWETVRTSITTHRGCGGGCSFCSLALHQGRKIASRSHKSLLAEAARIAAGSVGGDAKKTKPPRWAGSISDVGGPSANMWQAKCSLPPDKVCVRDSCLHPAPCPLFKVDQSRGVALLRAIARLPGVRHVRVASGVRFDLVLQDPEALFAYTSEFTGGQLKVAPEHSEGLVLQLMRKPAMAIFERFLDAFSRLCLRTGKELYTVPYLMSAFPGCTEAHMRNLSAWLRRRNWSPRQVQCFIPTPGTVATGMYYARVDPNGNSLYIARTDRERLAQHRLLLEEKIPARANRSSAGKKTKPGGILSCQNHEGRNKAESLRRENNISKTRRR